MPTQPTKEPTMTKILLTLLLACTLGVGTSPADAEEVPFDRGSIVCLPEFPEPCQDDLDPLPEGCLDPLDDLPCQIENPEPCQEDEPCWDCATMGNFICGPEIEESAPAAQPILDTPTFTG